MRESTPDEGAIYRLWIEPFQGMSVILMTPEKLKSWKKLLTRLARGAASAGWRAKGEQAILAPS